MLLFGQCLEGGSFFFHSFSMGNHDLEIKYAQEPARSGKRKKIRSLSRCGRSLKSLAAFSLNPQARSLLAQSTSSWHSPSHSLSTFLWWSSMEELGFHTAHLVFWVRVAVRLLPEIRRVQAVEASMRAETTALATPPPLSASRTGFFRSPILAGSWRRRFSPTARSPKTPRRSSSIVCWSSLVS